ncbi:MAG: MCE family protein [Bacteroidia bacterium]|nr:MCE family protein [Bacteroidia bacterium]
MKKESGNKIKLGVFVATGVVLFIAGIYFIGKTKQLFNTTFRISAEFANVSGLQVGNNVRFGGITVGTIEDINIISDTIVRVDMVIDEDTRRFIRRDARAIIGSDGLMGNKVMNITPGTPGQPEIKDKDMMLTITPVSMDDMFATLKVTADNAALITDDMAAVFDNIRSGRGTIGKLLMDTTFAGNLDKTIINVKQGTAGFNQNMQAAKKSILLRGYFKKKEQAAEDKKEEKQEKKNESK